MNQQLKEPEVSFAIVTELDVSGRAVQLVLEQKQEGGIPVFVGKMVEGQKLPVVGLLTQLIPGLPTPDSMNRLTIAKLELKLSPKYEIYKFEAKIENAWSIELDFSGNRTTIGIAELSLLIDSKPSDSVLAFKGNLILFDKPFIVTLDKRVSRIGGQLPTNLWVLKGQLKEPISLSGLVSEIIGETPDAFGLDTLDISVLECEVIQGSKSSYAFRGALDWNTGIQLAAGDPLIIQAAVDIHKEDGKPVAGAIAGSVSAAIPIFENLKLSVIYKFGQTVSRNDKELIFQLKLGNFTLNATYKSGSGGDTIITFNTNDTSGDAEALSFGKLITFMVNLVDPGVDDFELDPPWDELNKLTLSGIEVEINLTRKTVKASYKPKSPIDLIFIKISSIGLVYPRADGTRSVDIVIVGSFLGKSDTLAWDAINESPPDVPGEGSTIFDLQYLGVGQRVSFAPEVVAQMQNITQVINELKGSLIPLERADRNKNPLDIAGERGLQFNANSSWLIGAQFTVIETLDMSIIFNDPLLYGVRIGLAGAKAKIFAGLIFEILYRRVSDTVGVYHIELVLPDAMRQLEFGAVSITLPIVVLDIYTNGDFKIDFGFPWNFNFARSFGVEVFPFTGAGGFYFNKLSAETATSVPIITNGVFNPVIEFGLGLKIGLGKTFNKGVLRAELSITVQGILEGVIAWFNPTDPALPSEQYYRIQGGVAIVGRLWGVVDFEVIQVEVEVIVRVAVVFVIEAYQPIFLTLTAQVSVKASIKIVFVRIHFSFKLTLTQKFTLGSAKRTPWILDPDQSKRKPVTGTGTAKFMAASPSEPFAPARFDAPVEEIPEFDASDTPVSAMRMATPPDSQPLTTVDVFAEEVEELAADEADSVSATASLEAQLAEIAFSVSSTPTPLSWQAIGVEIPGLSTSAINLYFQPTVTRSASGIEGVALLFVQNSIAFDAVGADSFAGDAATTNTDFDRLMQVLLTWAIDAYYVQAGTASTAANRVVTPDNYQQISLSDLEALYEMIIQGEQDQEAAFTFDQLLAFLQRNFTFNITDRTSDLSGTIFPMFPQLRMQVGSGSVIAFDGEAFRLDASDRQYFTEYFQQLKGSHGSTVERNSTSQNGSMSSDDSFSVATFIFVDYFGLLVRSAIQSAIEYTENSDRTTISLAELLQALNRGGQFNHIAGMASRFLLHGLRLPDWTGDQPSPNRPTIPLYRATGQQFNLAANVGTDFAITLSKSASNLNWITFEDYVNDETTKQNSPTLQYFLTSALVRLISELNAVASSRVPELLPLNPAFLPLYEDVPRRFNIQQKTDWARLEQGQATPLSSFILDLPQDLRDYQETKYLPARRANQVDTGVSLTLKYGTPPEGSRELKPENIRDLTNYTWATKVNVTVRRVPSLDGTALLDKTYLMVGTDEAGKDLLEDLWQHLHDAETRNAGITPKLYLLYSAGGKDVDGNRVPGLTNQIPVESLLLKTNLSTDSTSSTQAMGVRAFNVSSASPDESEKLYSTTLNEGKTFIQLLWEGSTVNSGGYYLRYAVNTVVDGQPASKGFPDDIFTDGLSASLVLLVELKAPATRTTPLPAYHFQNCVVLSEDLNLENGVLYTESTDTVKALSVPPGNIGFKLTRSVAIVQSDNASGEDELQSLYQMLGYRLLDTEDFSASNEGLPVGPAEDDNLWSYDRVIPIYGLAKHRNTPDASSLPARLRSLPSAQLDPYAGIDANAQLTLEFHWQDVYGNRLTTNGGKQLSPNIRYFDRLLGINQWSSVAESYRFKPIQGNSRQVELIIELVFDQTPYIPIPGRPFTEAQQKASTARATYEQVYYQIHQPDVAFTVHTSVLPNASHTFTSVQKKQVTDFVEAAYLYLSTLEELEPQIHTVQSGNTLETVSNAYHVTVKALAAANADVPNLFAVGTALVLGELNYTTVDGDSLRLIEQKVEGIAPELNLTLADIAEKNPTVALHSGVTLVIPDRVTIANGLPSTTTIPDNATLEGITSTLLADRKAIGETGIFSIADIAIANQSIIGLMRAGVSVSLSYTIANTREPNNPTIINASVTTRPNETFYTLTTQLADGLEQEARQVDQSIERRVTVADVTAVVANTPNFLVAGQTLIVPPVSIIQTDEAPTNSSHVSIQFNRADDEGTLLYPTDQFIFPVTVQIDMTRREDFVDAAIQADVPEIQKITAFLSPKTTPLSASVTGTNEKIASLRQFATDFEAAFSNLHLAVGNELPHKHSEDATNPDSDSQVSQPIWAVHFGENGIEYNINESTPFFFSPAPLSNTLLAGTVELDAYESSTGLKGEKEPKRVEAIDLNVLARDFLRAVEEFLDPAIAIPAMKAKPDNVKAILQHKETLADAIKSQVTHILAQTDNTDISERRNIAADALRQQLLVNLVEAFDIETIIQYNVDVAIANIDKNNPNWTYQKAPRLFGQPVVEELKSTKTNEKIDPSSLNFTLSSGKIPLSQEGSYLTFFFNTKSPEKFEDLRLNLVYRVNELEYDIADVEGINNYQASSWLSFILPIDSIAPNSSDPSHPNYIGNVDIPIPLRTYPIPPSLVLHRAEADPDSLERLQDIRQWQYTLVYEHLDVAQDAIESKVDYNTPSSADADAETSAASTNVSVAQQPLFSALVNFATIYPQLLSDLKELANDNSQLSAEARKRTLDAFTSLVGDVATTWQDWRTSADEVQTHVADYEINEEMRQVPVAGSGGQTIEVKDVTIAVKPHSLMQSFPTMIVPGYRQDVTATRQGTQGSDKTITYRFQKKSPEDAANDPIFGESSIPDRVFSIPDLDIIEQQNAWGAIWLTRNKNLLSGWKTNPAFVYQTPQVRFGSMVTPLLVNAQHWNIATINSSDGTPQNRTLAAHLQNLFDTLLPDIATKPYDFRVACRYGFALVLAEDDDSDLLSTLPVLLSPRFSVPAGEDGLAATAELRSHLVTDIEAWYEENNPVATKARFIFSVSIFSNPDKDSSSDTINLPLIQIEHLEVRLENIVALARTVDVAVL
ncbi:MAG TPA: LysM domain-containing protein [Stenomitos sp.]